MTRDGRTTGNRFSRFAEANVHKAASKCEWKPKCSRVWITKIVAGQCGREEDDSEEVESFDFATNKGKWSTSRVDIWQVQSSLHPLDIICSSDEETTLYFLRDVQANCGPMPELNLQNLCLACTTCLPLFDNYSSAATAHLDFSLRTHEMQSRTFFHSRQRGKWLQLYSRRAGHSCSVSWTTSSCERNLQTESFFGWCYMIWTKIDQSCKNPN